MMLCQFCAALFTFDHPGTRSSYRFTREMAERAPHYPCFGELDDFQMGIMRTIDSTPNETPESLVPKRPWVKGTPRQHMPARGQGGSGQLCRILACRSEYPTWKHVITSASEGCQLCKTLVAMIQYAAKARGITITDSCLILSHWWVGKSDCVPHWLLCEAVDCDSILELYFHVDVKDDENIPASELIFPHELSGTSTDDRKCIEFLSQALNDCLGNHGQYCQPVHADHTWIPKRLLDVSPKSQLNPCLDSIVLVERADIERSLSPTRTIGRIQYLTLSHSWGDPSLAGLPSKLKKGNLAQHKTVGMVLQELPKCFQDAVKVSRGLGIRYLWIDALCIIQDSQEDWAHESATMDKVYLHGVCNLAACDSPNSHTTFFSHRDPVVGGPTSHAQMYYDDEPERTSTSTFTLIPDWSSLVRIHAPLYRRGWVLQERCLSPRIVHLSQFLTWECRLMVTTEPYSPHKIPYELIPEFPRPERDLIFSASENCARDCVKSIVDRWWETVHQYSKCNLTKSSDKLAALGGIAKSFSAIIREPYYAGLWGGQHFVTSLLWQRERKFEDRYQPVDEYRAPSWSWASIDGPVCNKAEPAIEDLAKVRSVHMMPKIQSNMFGQIVGGELVVEGFLLEMVSRRVKYEKWYIFSYFDNSLDVDTGDKLWFIPLQLLQPRPKPPVGLSDVCAGLITREVVQNSPGSYRAFRRVGYQSWMRFEYMAGLEEKLKSGQVEVILLV